MAKPETQPEQSESMEEILQSIKRIMDDNTAGDAKPSEELDVFDLTNVVKDDGSTAEIPTVPDDFGIGEEEHAVPTVDASFPEVEERVVQAPKNYQPDEGLMSEQSVSAAATQFKKIVDSTQKDYSIPNIPSPQLRNGNTVEDLVIEALKPMLKDWLDKNLPVIVQRIVEKEVKRIVTLHKDD